MHIIQTKSKLLRIYNSYFNEMVIVISHALNLLELMQARRTKDKYLKQNISSCISFRILESRNYLKVCSRFLNSGTQ